MYVILDMFESFTQSVRQTVTPPVSRRGREQRKVLSGEKKEEVNK